ncbi:hypothetical protein AURDEDRAFT_169872 [Auricularia subglabra TFB-10046 SS5]|nr:hypothetical protein AURDEDRAFT_169872 [Auricularia subglabra TFB-10046 SS5]
MQEHARLREEFDALRNEKIDLERRLEEAKMQNRSITTTIIDLRNAAVEDAGKIEEYEENLRAMTLEKQEHTSKMAAAEAENIQLARSLRQLKAKVAELEKQALAHRPVPHERAVPAINEEQCTPHTRTEEGSRPRGGGTKGHTRLTRRRMQEDTAATSPRKGQSPSIPEVGEEPEPEPAARNRKRRRVEKQGPNNGGDADETQPGAGKTVTTADLKAAFPEQFAELARIKGLERGLYKGYRIFELAGELLWRLDLDSTPSKGLHVLYKTKLPGRAHRVNVSAWSVLEASGCYASEGTYRNRHSSFTRMSRWHELFFVHPDGAERLAGVGSERAREILQDVRDFFAGRPTGGTTEDWQQRLRDLKHLVPDWAAMDA